MMPFSLFAVLALMQSRSQHHDGMDMYFALWTTHLCQLWNSVPSELRDTDISRPQFKADL